MLAKLVNKRKRICYEAKWVLGFLLMLPQAQLTTDLRPVKVETVAQVIEQVTY